MAQIAYVNGRYLPQRTACVNIEDRGYQFGDGIYEVLYCHQGRLIDEELHLARLTRSLGEIGLPPPRPPAALRAIIGEVLRRNRITTGLVYMQVTRGVARREHAFPRPRPAPSLVITARRLKPPPKDVRDWAASSITHPDERWARCDIKSTNLLPNVLAREAARKANAYEAILIDQEGFVTEGAASSVWIVDADGILRTRALDRRILPGCTRAALLTDLETHSLTAREGPIILADLRAAREIFLTSATSFIKPIIRLDGAPVGLGTPGPIASFLYARYLELMAAPAPG